MSSQVIRWFGAVLLCCAVGAPVQAQDEQPAAPEPVTPPAPQIAPIASSLPAEPCADTCPTSASAIDQDDDSTGWLIIGIGGSVAATTLALGISMSAQAGTNAESRLGSASIAGGIAGVAVSLLVGLLAM